jgi:hypothetical protein
MSMYVKFAVLAAVLAANPVRSMADSVAHGALIRVDSHTGQMDTDGILSPGEVPNPNINYDHAQQRHEREGDARVENPYNDAAADEDRRYNFREDKKEEQREQQREREEERREDSWWWNR